MEWKVCGERAGFVQRLVLLSWKGYPYFILNHVPDRLEEDAIDEKMLGTFPIELSKRRRAYRKEIGLENGHYIRHGRTWLLMMTDPSFALEVNEKERVLDMRGTPINVLDYAISLKPDGSQKRAGGQKLRTRVALAPKHYAEQKAYFDSLALHRNAETIGAEMWKISSYHVKYAPIYRQWRAILNRVNAARKKAGYDRVPYKHIRWYAPAPKHFGSPDDAMYELLSEDAA